MSDSAGLVLFAYRDRAQAGQEAQGVKARASVEPLRVPTRSGPVAIPPHVLPVVKRHLALYVPAEPDALVFRGSQGGAMRPSKF